jgi:hypothetical protein
MKKRWIAVFAALTLTTAVAPAEPSVAAENDNNVEWDGLFHDQGRFSTARSSRAARPR